MADADSPDDAGIVTLTLDDREVSLSVPDDADADEAAAIATVLGAHLHDQQAAAAASESEDEQPRVSQWKLAGRMKSQGKRHWPNDVKRGEEWKAAARSFY
jgi:hypothetical protein